MPILLRFFEMNEVNFENASGVLKFFFFFFIQISPVATRDVSQCMRYEIFMIRRVLRKNFVQLYKIEPGNVRGQNAWY